MAIYHFSGQVISRSSGRTSVGSAAYRARERLYNDYDGLTHDYTAKYAQDSRTIDAPEQCAE